MKALKVLLIAVCTVTIAACFSSCLCSRNRVEDRSKKTFFYRNEGKAKTLDPQKQFDAYSASAATLIYDSLYMFHYLKRPYEIVPNLAADLPTYSADGRVMSIKLRDDVSFHDNACFQNGKGRGVDANDVLYTLHRLADSNVNDQGSVTLLEGLIEGIDDFIKKSKSGSVNYEESKISGLRAVSKYEIEVRLTKPTTVVFNVLANAITSIVPRECVEFYGLDFGFNPVGSGPFTISYKNRKGDMVLKKNPRYHLKYPDVGAPGDLELGLLKDAGKPLPMVDEVILPVIEESQPAMLKFLRGDLDWVRLDADSFRDMAVKSPEGAFYLKEPYSKKFALFPGVDLAAYWWVFNMKDELVGKNKKLRLAMAHAINRQGFVDDIFNGRGVVLDSMIPSTVTGNAKEVGVSWYPYNPSIARQLLKEAGYPGGKGLPPIKLFYASSPTIQRQYEYIRRNLDEVGIKLELETAPYTSYTKKFAEGGFQFSIGGWGADYLDPENFLMLFTKDALANELMYGGGWTNPEYEELFKKVRQLQNGPERFALIKQMLEIVKADAPYIPQFTSNRIGLNAPWLKNWKRNMADDREAVYIDIDQDLREKGYAP